LSQIQDFGDALTFPYSDITPSKSWTCDTDDIE
jgi:hypothetical protein